MWLLNTYLIIVRIFKVYIYEVVTKNHRAVDIQDTVFFLLNERLICYDLVCPIRILLSRDLPTRDSDI